LDVMRQLREVRKVVGYCPQFDGLTDLLTVREHIELYARLRGVPSDQINTMVVQKMEQLDLNDFEKRLAGTLSGGNKRKLSVAIATIGNPPIVFLDEPSTGMDPVARRFMWKVIADISTASKESTVILTTHSMEECEALCTQVAIMVGGRFRCHGNVQRLKARYGQGFTVTLKLASKHSSDTAQERADVDHEAISSRISDFFTKEFVQVEVVEATSDHMVFKLLQKDQKVSAIFDTLEKHKQSLGIVEYSVNQTTLEQIFNYFAGQQEEEKAPAPGIKGRTPTDHEMEGVEMPLKT